MQTKSKYVYKNIAILFLSPTNQSFYFTFQMPICRRHFEILNELGSTDSTCCISVDYITSHKQHIDSSEVFNLVVDN